MKILLASTSSGSRGGGELCLLYLGQALAARGHDVTLWASEHPRMDELATAFGTHGRVVRAAYRNTYDRPGRSVASFYDRITAHRVAKEWRDLAPDVVHVNKQNLEDGLDLLVAAEQSQLPALAMIHITQSAKFLRAGLAAARDYVARHALQRFPGLLVTTPESRRVDLAAFLGDSPRLRVVLNGVPLPKLSHLHASRAQTRGKLNLQGTAPLFLAVGRMVPQKRPLLFLATAKRILREWPDAHFLWVGDGALTSEWDRWVSGNQLQHKISRLPWQTDVAPWLGAADVFLHLAEFEGLSFALLEALAAGLPCALSANLASELTFLSNENSVTIGEGCHWLERLRDPAQRTALGAAARKLAEDQFSFARMAADYEALYREVRKKRP